MPKIIQTIGYRATLAALLLAVTACSTGGDVAQTDNLSIKTPTAPLPANDLYSDLPTGPKNTGTYPDLSQQPVARISDISQVEVDQMIAKLEALEKAQRNGAISPDVYDRRLAELKRLAANHSPDMLARINARRPI